MYIKKLVYEHVGPIRNIEINMPMNDNRTPKPVILVGENGSGKSTLLSNIVDAFYEIAGKAYNNARQPDDDSGHQYYKAITPIEISSGQKYMFSYIALQDSKEYSYIYKCGNLSVSDLKKKLGLEKSTNLRWSESVNFKHTSCDKEDANRIWNNSVICYFGPDRYEKPAWMGDKYHQIDNFAHPTLRANWNGKLDAPISVKDVVSVNLQWLLDVIVDSRPDVEGNIGNLSLSHVDAGALIELRKARENLELIMSNILGEDVYFGLNFRNSGRQRLKIQRKKDGSVIAPSLDSLSTGQLAIFNMFATIIRYADLNMMNRSIDLSKISGIVAIDEIELHLHAKLQKEVLPKLIKLFPNVQFVITTHAPLFLLGMQETFGDDGYEIYEMPAATRISVERFSEFQRAYDYFKKTEAYQKDAQEAIASVMSSKNAIVVTEGATDWKHMKTAMAVLRDNEVYAELFDGLDFDFFEYEPANSKDEAEHKLEMGDKALISICENYAKLPQNVRYIFVADRDVETTSKKMGCTTGQYKKWAPNVYSFLLPIPESRKETPYICIEHMYSDEQIKTEVVVNGVARRLYLGNEFDCRGLAPAIDRYCEKSSICGPDKISIIEGSQGDKITSINGNDGVANYALSKMNFAKHVMAHPECFNFDNFVEIFKIIKAIIEEENGNA